MLSNVEGDSQAYVIVASYDSPTDAFNSIPQILKEQPTVDLEVLETINGKFAVSVGLFDSDTSRRLLVTRIRAGSLPKDSFLLDSKDIFRSIDSQRTRRSH